MFDTLEKLQAFLQDIKCSVGGIEWGIEANYCGSLDYHIQLTYDEADIITGKVEKQFTRKWLVSRCASPSQIAQTVLKAALTSAEHMVREHFTYKGAAVFNPHQSLEDLVEISRKHE